MRAPTPLNILAILLLTLSINIAFASPPEGEMHHAHMAAHSVGEHMATAGHDMHDKGIHTFSPPWMATLNDQQKLKIDKMHLALSKKQATLKMKKKMLKSELKLLVIEDKANMSAIDKKIDEIASISRDMMKNRYSHMVEMRSVLTDEQRVTFDLGVLQKKDKEKHGDH